MSSGLFRESFFVGCISKVLRYITKFCARQVKDSAFFGGDRSLPDTLLNDETCLRTKIKVLRIIARLNIGGPARHVAILTEALNSDRYSSLLAYGALGEGEGDMSYLAEEPKIRSIFIPGLVREISPVNDLKAFIKIFSIMRKERPHIVHTHTAKAGTLGRLAAILAGVPIKVHTFHGHIFYGYFNALRTRVFLWIERFLTLFTDCVIAISEKQKEELLRKYKIGNEKKYSVINLGFDLEKFMHPQSLAGKFRAERGLPSSDILIGAVGRLVSVKNHRMLIRVAERLRSDIGLELFSRVKFVIIGDGPEKQNLIEYSRSKRLEGQILFAGWVKDIERAYADLDVVVMTSRNEGTPLSLIEAFASSKPVIATNVGGVGDIAKDIGILVEESDEASFARNLSELVKSPPRRREIGSRGRECVVKKFSKENLINCVEKLYEELLAKKGITA